jgi:hypothetical protein
MCEYRYYHIPEKGELRAVASLAEAQAATTKGGFIWLDYG